MFGLLPHANEISVVLWEEPLISHSCVAVAVNYRMTLLQSSIARYALFTWQPCVSMQGSAQSILPILNGCLFFKKLSLSVESPFVSAKAPNLYS